MSRPPLVARSARPSITAAATVAAVVIVSINLRPAIVAIGPLTGAIRSGTGLDLAAISLLTTLPLLCFAGLSLPATRLAGRIGTQRAVFLATVLIAAGIGLRMAEPTAALFAGSAVAGGGIALGNVLIPALVKRDFPHRTGLMMSVYNGALQIGAALASGVTLPLRSVLHIGWRATLGLWVVPVIPAVAVWAVRGRHRPSPPEEPVRLHGVGRSPLGRSCIVFVGIESGIFYSLTAWMPSILEAHGMASDEAGIMLSVVAVCGILGGLAVPLLTSRLARPGLLVPMIGGAFLLGLLGLLLDPVPLAALSAVCLGLGQGGGLGFATTMFNLRSRTTMGATQLSGVAQTGGYAIAAVGPLLVGSLHDATGTWTLPLIVLATSVVVLLRAGRRMSRGGTIEQSVNDGSEILGPDQPLTPMGASS